MADIQKRLVQLRSRRVGDDRPTRTYLSAAATQEALLKSLIPSNEGWERHRESQPFTSYALGAMQEVGAEYTRVSVEEADRVATLIKPRLAQRGIPADFRLQGSVPLNVHIRRVSDVDLLALDTSHTTFELGAMARASTYLYTPARSSSAVLSNLRQQVVSSLRDAFPLANVDSGNAKAVSISGGSLRRFVDVVPSHWHDTLDYQTSHVERDRGVTILNARTGATINNLPFLHIFRVIERCSGTYGGLRKAIRLCKQVKADMEADGRTVPLPSFDIAGLMYHADMAALRYGKASELAILAETQRHLDFLATNRGHASQLVTPDGLRRILDDDKKFEGLSSLSVEIDDLLRQVAREQGVREPARHTMEQLRGTLKQTTVSAN